MIDIKAFLKDPKNKGVVRPYLLWSRLRYLAILLAAIFAIPTFVFQLRFDNVINTLEQFTDYQVEINGILYLVFQLFFDGSIAFLIVASVNTRRHYRSLSLAIYQSEITNEFTNMYGNTIDSDAIDVSAKESTPVEEKPPVVVTKKEAEVDPNSLSFRLKALRESYEKGEISQDEYRKKRNELLDIS